MTQIEIENRPAFGYNKATEAKKRQAKESGESAMFTLLILADDFTGALDTGVQISKTGAKTVVLTDPHADLERFADGTDVLVIDAETRHISPQQAKECVASIVRRAFALNVPCIYKKTDSALRGNIGAELEAVAEQSPEGQLFFVPAFPQMNRTTEHGQQLIEGMPVAQSVFGQDPFEPVRNSDVAAIIAEQSKLPTVITEAGEPIRLTGPGIQIYDAKSMEDIRKTGEVLRQNGKLNALAGCAGFAAILPSLLGLEHAKAARQPRLDKRLLVICGSVNPITLSQLDEAEQNGFVRLRLTPEEKLTDHYWETPAGQEKLKAMTEAVSRSDCIIIDTNDADGNRSTRQYAEQRQMKVEEMRQCIADSIGRTAKYLIEADGPGENGTCRTLMITGGDVLIQTMGELGVAELHPICEMDPGVVLSGFTCKGQKRYVLSKSGGFGPSDQLLRILNKLNQTIEE